MHDAVPKMRQNIRTVTLNDAMPKMRQNIRTG